METKCFAVGCWLKIDGNNLNDFGVNTYLLQKITISKISENIKKNLRYLTYLHRYIYTYTYLYLSPSDGESCRRLLASSSPLVDLPMVLNLAS